MTTYYMTDEAVEAVYLFIAEMNGYKRGTLDGKIAYGIECFKNNELPEAEGDELHEHIWLTRIYNELNKLMLHKFATGTYDGFHWSVPIELDASASMLGITGALLNDNRLLTMTNMFGDENVINDPWHVEGLTRNHVKKVAVPRLYGSDQATHALWTKAGLEFDMEKLTLMNEQFSKGAIGLADSFKEFVVNNCNPKPEMTVKIWEEKFKISCNHYKRVGDVHAKYDLYDSDTGRIRRVTHTKTRMVPDLDRFKRYFQTLLIHNLDSQAADYVSGKTFDKYGFVLDIHDAYIVSPVAAVDVRKWYCEFMEAIHKDRQMILEDYFKSIGITGTAMEEWDKLQRKIVPVKGAFKCRPIVLK